LQVHDVPFSMNVIVLLVTLTAIKGH